MKIYRDQKSNLLLPKLSSYTGDEEFDLLPEAGDEPDGDIEFENLDEFVTWFNKVVAE